MMIDIIILQIFLCIMKLVYHSSNCIQNITLNRKDFRGGRWSLYFHSDRALRPSAIKSDVPSVSRYVGI